MQGAVHWRSRSRRDRDGRLSSFQLALAILNFSFDEITQFISLEYFFRDMCSAIYKTKTTGLIAIALKRACHLPFSGRIKESELFAFCDIAQSSYFHFTGVKKTVRIASMINVLQEIRMQGNMCFIACLHS